MANDEWVTSPRTKWTEALILTEIKATSKNGVATTKGNRLHSAAVRFFGSWLLACRAAGVETYYARPPITRCRVEGCEATPSSRYSGLCDSHYWKSQRAKWKEERHAYAIAALNPPRPDDDDDDEDDE